MGLLDFLKRKKKNCEMNCRESNSQGVVNDVIPEAVAEEQKQISVRQGFVSLDEIEIDECSIEKIKTEYIAFDVETTGLSPAMDRIIEVGAVRFVNGKPMESFSSLVNAKVTVSERITEINHITNEMLAHAPCEDEVYSRLVAFVNGAFNAQVVFCCHNARFDMSFLRETLLRLGYDAKIRYVDTLRLSRKYLKGLCNYKQETVANSLNLFSVKQHRAMDDARTCGEILKHLLFIVEKEFQQPQIQKPKVKDSVQTKENKNNNPPIPRESVEVKPVHNRVPLNQIKNFGDWDKGYTKGAPYHRAGEDLRLAGETQEAIRLFELARYYGYDAPALYESYVKAYRQLKDYENEIEICEEALERLDPRHAKPFCERRDKAIQLLFARQEQQRKQVAIIAKKNQIEEKSELEDTNVKRRPAILQLTEEGTLISTYPTVAEATRRTGINSKSIRDAAKGIQKHAGGFVWKYSDSN